MRTWNIEKILNSDLPNEIKEVISHEYYGKELSLQDPNNYSIRRHSYKTFKDNYHKFLVNLLCILDDYYYYGDVLHRKYSIDDLCYYEFTPEDRDVEDLLEYIAEFYHELGDKEISRAIDYLFDKDKQFLHIQPYNPDNPICQEVRGRCIRPYNHDGVYASYYMRGTFEDFSILTHETGHMLTHVLFKEVHPYVGHFITELDSYLFELLMNHHISTNLDCKDLADCLEANRLSKVVDTIWNIRTQQILYRQIGRKPNIRRLNRKLNREGHAVSYQDGDFDRLTTLTLPELNTILHSFFVAIHFYKRVIEDQEKGIAAYKSFVTSTEPTVPELYQNHHIDYDEIQETMDDMYEKALILAKEYKKN